MHKRAHKTRAVAQKTDSRIADVTESFDKKVKPSLYESEQHQAIVDVDADVESAPRLETPPRKKSIPSTAAEVEPHQKKKKTKKIDDKQVVGEMSDELTKPSAAIEQLPSPKRAKSPSPTRMDNSHEHARRSPRANDKLRCNFFRPEEEYVMPISPGGDAAANFHPSHNVTGTVAVKAPPSKGILFEDFLYRHEASNEVPGEVTSYFVLDEGGWGWMVCFASFYANFVIFGLMASFSELNPHINKSYFDGSENTKWMGVLQCVIMLLFAPAVVVAEETIGLQASTFLGALAGSTALLASSFVPSVNVLFVTYSFVTGAAYAFVYVPSLVILGHYFDSMLGLVAGFVQVGTAMGVVCMPLLVEVLVRTLGVRTAMRVVCVFTGTLVLCGLAWKPTYRRDVSTLPPAPGRRSVLLLVSRFFNFSVWTNFDYVLWSAAMVLSAVGRLVPTTFMASFAKQQRIGSNIKVLELNFWAASGLTGFVVGGLGDLSSVSRVTIQQIGFVVWAISLSIVSFVQKYEAIVCVVLLLGMGNGATMSVVVPMLFDLLGPAGASAGLGSVLGLMAPLSFIGPILTAELVHEYFTYGLPFFVTALPSIVSAVLLSFVCDERTYSRALSRTSRKESGIVGVDYPTGESDERRITRRILREERSDSELRLIDGPSKPSLEPQSCPTNELLAAVAGTTAVEHAE